MIVSPCISICKTDPVSGYCYGCARKTEEKIAWKNPETTDEWKKKNLKELKGRMSGWQLDASNCQPDILPFNSFKFFFFHSSVVSGFFQAIFSSVFLAQP